MRGHPVFVAQHATATCCRGCLARWHGIPAGRVLTSGERQHVVAAIGHWLAARAAEAGGASPPLPRGGRRRADAVQGGHRPGAAPSPAQDDLFGPEETA
jgi:hypothetical protein